MSIEWQKQRSYNTLEFLLYFIMIFAITVWNKGVQEKPKYLFSGAGAAQIGFYP